MGQRQGRIQTQLTPNKQSQLDEPEGPGTVPGGSRGSLDPRVGKGRSSLAREEDLGMFGCGPAHPKTSWNIWFGLGVC